MQFGSYPRTDIDKTMENGGRNREGRLVSRQLGIVLGHGAENRCGWWNDRAVIHEFSRLED
jgi:hypothetical protein